MQLQMSQMGRSESRLVVGGPRLVERGRGIRVGGGSVIFSLLPFGGGVRSREALSLFRFRSRLQQGSSASSDPSWFAEAPPLPTQYNLESTSGSSIEVGKV